jgi:hypothetical protein
MESIWGPNLPQLPVLSEICVAEKLRAIGSPGYGCKVPPSDGRAEAHAECRSPFDPKRR